jgi:hypothetical protein
MRLRRLAQAALERIATQSTSSSHVGLVPLTPARPAFRSPSSSRATPSARRNGATSASLQTRKSGSSSRRWVMALRACGRRPTSALLAAKLRSADRKFGDSFRDLSAHDDASSYRPAQKLASASAPCIPNSSGSSGLRRMARITCSFATSGSPR